MSQVRRPPARTCVACGDTTDKRRLVRFVRTKTGEVSVDPTGKVAGRGAYVCPDTACFERAVKKGRIDPALRVRLTEEDVERLRDDFEACLAEEASSIEGR